MKTVYVDPILRELCKIRMASPRNAVTTCADSSTVSRNPRRTVLAD
jgi:hypothetical protein